MRMSDIKIDMRIKEKDSNRIATVTWIDWNEETGKMDRFWYKWSENYPYIPRLGMHFSADVENSHYGYNGEAFFEEVPEDDLKEFDTSG